MYNTNLARLAVSLMPDHMRHPVMMVITAAAARPLDTIALTLRTLRTRIDEQIAVNNSVRRLEDKLNALFCLTDRQINISSRTADDSDALLLCHQGETGSGARAIRTSLQEEGTPDVSVSTKWIGEYPAENSFNVLVPTFLISSTDTTDPTEAAHLRLIRETINQNKPVGRTFGIKTYQYE